ncbi:hypothetical protein DPMN_037922 [Dreissena polymorpha]|uniref:Uncharacterized protein n=1 Tax=Dreissena polymorpha TaxID=45954 RepID=A0A9D4MEA2_DREPO|nr:hypothetical protein DPMN_037922 [Dreissena polymorpha]
MATTSRRRDKSLTADSPNAKFFRSAGTRPRSIHNADSNADTPYKTLIPSSDKDIDTPVSFRTIPVQKRTMKGRPYLRQRRQCAVERQTNLLELTMKGNECIEESHKEWTQSLLYLHWWLNVLPLSMHSICIGGRTISHLTFADDIYTYLAPSIEKHRDQHKQHHDKLEEYFGATLSTDVTTSPPNLDASCGHKCLRRLLRISFTEHKTIKRLKRDSNSSYPHKPLLATVKRRKVPMFEHFTRHESLCNIVLYGTLEKKLKQNGQFERPTTELNIIGTNLQTKKNAPHPGSHVFQPTLLEQMNLRTKFHEDRTVNVASRVLTGFYYSHIRKNAPPLGSHFIQANIINFELIQDIIKTNLLTIFHEDWTVNVASRVKNAPPVGGLVFQANVTIFELIQNIIKTNLLTIFHQDWTINVASRVLTRTRFGANQPTKQTNQQTGQKQYVPHYYSGGHKNALPPGGHVFQPIGIISELVQDIIGMNLLTKENAPPLGSHFFQAKVTIFELIQDISGTNILSKVLTRKNAPPPGGNVFQQNGIIFELVQDIGMNLLTKFYEDQTINVASRVKNAQPLGSHVFQANVTIFELIQDIIETKILTKFHEDWK